MTDGVPRPVVSLDVSFGEPPPASMVTPLCQSLSELCGPVVHDSDAAARLRLTAHELLENIVKYSSPGGCLFRFQLHRVAGGALRAMIQTSNVPEASRRDDAEQRLTALNAAHDPRQHYDSVIAESARRPAGSGLGLARIHAETEYRLSYHFEERALVITASGDVSLNDGPP